MASPEYTIYLSNRRFFIIMRLKTGSKVIVKSKKLSEEQSSAFQVTTHFSEKKWLNLYLYNVCVLMCFDLNN